MHYVAFLVDHGKAPYRDIAEMNMPGAPMVDYLVIHILGPGSLAWRLFDLGLIGSAILAMVAIARPYDWVAGLFAGVLLGVIHGSDGVFDAGQRDFVVAVLVLIGYAALFRSQRAGEPRWMFIFGLCAGTASTIKPTFILLGPALLIALFTVRRRSRHPSLKFMAYGLAGFLLPLLGMIAMLAGFRALHAFVATTRGIMLYHASLARRPLGFLLTHSISPLVPLICIWLLTLPFLRSRWKSWEAAALAIGLLFGLLSYVVQAKGYPYQRYPLIALLLLVISVDLLDAIRGNSKVMRVLGYAGLVFGVLYLAPKSVWAASRYDWRDTEFLDLLEHDLNQLGGPALSGRVQCIDTTGGCYNALYREHLVQSTGFLYDEFIFGQDRNGVVMANRRAFWTAIQAQPPAVFIVVDGLFPSGPPGFGKLARWPQFDEYLRANYVMYAQRQPLHEVHWWNRPDPPQAYRLYVTKHD
jgi:hypothetical protein